MSRVTKTRKQKAQETKFRILDSALMVFASCGFEGASMPQIAKLSDTSVPLLVYYFQNKESLWKAAVERAVQPFDTRLKEIIANKDSATVTLRQIVIALVEVSTELPEFHRLMLLECHEDSPRLEWMYRRFAKDHNSMMIQVIKHAQQEGGVSMIDPQRMLHAIIGMATISTQAAEFKKLTNKNLFSNLEIQKTILAIEQLVFLL